MRDGFSGLRYVPFSDAYRMPHRSMSMWLVPLWQVLSPAGLLDAASIGLFIALQCAVYELRGAAEVGSPLTGTGAPAK